MRPVVRGCAGHDDLMVLILIGRVTVRHAREVLRTLKTLFRNS